MKYILFALCILILIGCTSTANQSDCSSGVCETNLESLDNSAESTGEKTVDKVEVYHFHGTNQCYSCKTVGAYAEETVNTYFKEELDSGKIVFNHINFDLLENSDLAMKYQVKSSSLWLGTYDNEGFHPEENPNVWFKINDKEDYMSYLKGLIEKRLAGDYS